jgi:hypothetical protein
MITIFTTAKAFTGHNGVIQRNALASWRRLHADVEVILFGDEEGAAEVSAELGLRHEPRVQRHESGMKYVPYLFGRAQELARHEYVCYANCDIILLKDFAEAFERVRGKFADFLMIGRRWDTDITEPIEFGKAQWERETRELAKRKGKQQIPAFIDYFCFRKGLYREIPPLVIGRNYWDHWLVWKALTTPVPVIDCSRAVMAVHQNHDYAYSAEGNAGTHGDTLAMHNKQLGGNGENLRSIRNATHIVTRGGWVWNVPKYERWTTLMELGTRQGMLEHTFWLRKRLGLRKETLAKVKRIVE